MKWDVDSLDEFCNDTLVGELRTIDYGTNFERSSKQICGKPEGGSTFKNK
jgi:hypothetical protein